jgi:hypothetical protein
LFWEDYAFAPPPPSLPLHAPQRTDLCNQIFPWLSCAVPHQSVLCPYKGQPLAL